MDSLSKLTTKSIRAVNTQFNPGAQEDAQEQRFHAMTDEIDGLLRVTTLLRERALEQYRRDLDEEARLQAEKDRIDALRMQVFTAEQDLSARRLTGADTLWQEQPLNP